MFCFQWQRWQVEIDHRIPHTYRRHGICSPIQARLCYVSSDQLRDWFTNTWNTGEKQETSKIKGGESSDQRETREDASHSSTDHMRSSLTLSLFVKITNVHHLHSFHQTAWMLCPSSGVRSRVRRSWVKTLDIHSSLCLFLIKTHCLQYSCVKWSLMLQLYSADRSYYIIFHFLHLADAFTQTAHQRHNSAR